MNPPHKTYKSVFHDEFKEDLAAWVKQDRKVAERIKRLVRAILDDPFRGIGKPEPLKYWEPTAWSRRINHEHRIVYRVKDDRIDFLQCMYHY
ncbi:Txe/YoeB family addiction module toxin [bacterium]|nr:Txe/YoeB family addiction module toxin [bacterium]